MLKKFILRDTRIIANLKRFIDETAIAMANNGKCMVVECFEETQKRSKAANARYWANTLKQISEQAWVEGRSFIPAIWHEYYKEKYCARMDGPNGKSYAIGTSDMSDKEFSEFVTNVEVHAQQELGVTFYELTDHMYR